MQSLIHNALKGIKVIKILTATSQKLLYIDNVRILRKYLFGSSYEKSNLKNRIISLFMYYWLSK